MIYKNVVGDFDHASEYMEQCNAILAMQGILDFWSDKVFVPVIYKCMLVLLITDYR